LRKLVSIVLTLFVLSFVAMAENLPQNEVFGGFSHLSVDTHNLPPMIGEGYSNPAIGLNGWEGAFTHFFNKNVGVTADFSGFYGSPQFLGVSNLDSKLHTFMAGPTVAIARDKTISGFGHALFGGSTLSLGSGEYTDRAFSLAIGGGLDAKVNKKFSVRIVQIDYLHSNYNVAGYASTQNNLRFATGLIYKF